MFNYKANVRVKSRVGNITGNVNVSYVSKHFSLEFPHRIICVYRMSDVSNAVNIKLV